jgi:uncharacterized membrane protein
MTGENMDTRARRHPSGAAGLFLGVGLGGFFDGILLHQIFQVHAMLSAKIPLDTMANMKTNMTADGVFHAVTWIATLIGVALLWHSLAHRDVSVRPSGIAFVGSMLAGWGWFNLVEGIIDHHVLGLHHVIEALGVSIWDWLFLASGVILIVVGHLMSRSAKSADV